MVANVANRDFCRAESIALFEGLESQMWDVSPDGDYFVTLAHRDPPRLHLVLDWATELQRLVPTGGSR